ncbi:gasdermin-E [Gastrophryne carolinensis]
MFAKATKNFLRDIDAGGDLIPVSSLNDSDKAQLLSVVEKKKRFWCWQKPKYRFSSCSCLLGDVLTDEKLVKPVLVESEFVKYEGTFGDDIRGNIDADFGAFHGNAAGRGRVETKSTFGILRKQEVDMQHLMKDVLNCKLNLHHPVIQQLHEYRNDVLCILKEKIITTQKCIISEHTKTEESFGGKLGLKTKIVKVSVTENGNFSQDENTVLEIPAPTAIAYSVVELLVKGDGQFEFCLLPEKQGGFEKDLSEKRQPLLCHTAALNDWDVVDGFHTVSVDGSASLSALKKDVLELSQHFSVLQSLPESHRLQLYYLLFEVLEDGQTVSRLQTMVEEIISGNRPSVTRLDDLEPPARELIQTILFHTGYDLLNQKLIEPLENDLLTAIHVLTSALDEMPDPALALLAACCKLHLLPALCALPTITSDEGLCPRTEAVMSDLIDYSAFQIAQSLFSLSNIKLEMNKTSISVTTSPDPGFLPLVLYIAISGFDALKKNFRL